MLAYFYEMLDLRSFNSVWYWITLIAFWARAGHSVLGVPVDVIAAAHRSLRAAPPEGETPEAVALLDWVSLHAPRWLVTQATGAVLLGIAAFVITALAVLSFGRAGGHPLAQAMFALLVPVAVLTGVRIHLAHRLTALLAAARQGAPNRAAQVALRQIGLYRIVFSMLAILSITLSALMAMRWLVLHPNGL